MPDLTLDVRVLAVQEPSSKKKWVTPSVRKVALNDELLARIQADYPNTPSRVAPEREHLVEAAAKAIRLRDCRNRHFPVGIFGEPAWDVLLAIYAREHISRFVSISQLAKAAGLSGSSALRWINLLSRVGLVDRQQDPMDRRTAQVRLTDLGRRTLDRFFEEVEIAFADLPV